MKLYYFKISSWVVLNCSYVNFVYYLYQNKRYHFILNIAQVWYAYEFFFFFKSKNRRFSLFDKKTSEPTIFAYLQCFYNIHILKGRQSRCLLLIINNKILLKIHL